MSPAESWLLVGAILFATALIVWAATTAMQDRDARRTRLQNMVADEAHMADLRRLQASLRSSYDPTPVDPSGRVWKRGTSDFDGGDAA